MAHPSAACMVSLAISAGLEEWENRLGGEPSTFYLQYKWANLLSCGTYHVSLTLGGQPRAGV